MRFSIEAAAQSGVARYLQEHGGEPHYGDEGETQIYNRPHRPYMVHRALYGSIERFFALLIEHHAGSLPVWLAPTQAVVIPVAERNLDYARKVGDELAAAGFRAEVDERQERMNAKIRDAQLQQKPRHVTP